MAIANMVMGKGCSGMRSFKIPYVIYLKVHGDLGFSLFNENGFTWSSAGSKYSEALTHYSPI